MSDVCNDDVSNHEVLGRILNETSQINKSGVVKPQIMYPKVTRPDQESGREKMFSNKLSVVRLCRGHKDSTYTWQIHEDKAKEFIGRSNNIFRGFMIAKAMTVRDYGLVVVPDGRVQNPYHAHIIIPDFNVDFNEGVTMAADVIPAYIRVRLDRLRMQMRTIILNKGDRYPANLNYASPSDCICNHCSYI